MNNDLISREALKDFINEICFSKEWAKYRVDNGSRGQIECILTYIDNAPSVEPYISPEVLNQFAKYVAEHERPQGEWINDYTAKQKKVVACNQCNCISIQGKSNFCPNCGAEMKGGAE